MTEVTALPAERGHGQWLEQVAASDDATGGNEATTRNLSTEENTPVLSHIASLITAAPHANWRNAVFPDHAKSFRDGRRLGHRVNKAFHHGTLNYRAVPRGVHNLKLSLS